jgi:hypothetical protein
MTTMAIIYPHNWVKHDVETNFKHCLSTLNDNFVIPKGIGPMHAKKYDVIQDDMALDNQAHLFVQITKKNFT